MKALCVIALIAWPLIVGAWMLYQFLYLGNALDAEIQTILK